MCYLIVFSECAHAVISATSAQWNARSAYTRCHGVTGTHRTAASGDFGRRMALRRLQATERVVLRELLGVLHIRVQTRGCMSLTSDTAFTFQCWVRIETLGVSAALVGRTRSHRLCGAGRSQMQEDMDGDNPSSATRESHSLFPSVSLPLIFK